jgi:hypothetical protein
LTNPGQKDCRIAVKFTFTSTSNGNKEFFNGYPEYIDLLNNISEMHAEQQSDEGEQEMHQESNEEIQALLQSNQRDEEIDDDSHAQLEAYQHQISLESDSKSPDTRRSRKSRDKKVFYSDLNEYLSQNQENNPYTDETPDQFAENREEEKEQTLKSYENSPNLMPQPNFDDDEDAIVHTHSDQNSKNSELRDTLSFANKSHGKESSENQHLSKDIS